MTERNRPIEILISEICDESSKKQCFDRIWRVYYPKLTVFIINGFGFPREQVKDLVQDVLMLVYTRMDRYSSSYAFSTWVYTIARNRCIDALRRRERQKGKVLSREELHEIEDGRSVDPLVLAVRKEEKERIGALLRGLPPEDRQIVFLHVYEGLTLREIGEVLGKPEGTIKYRYFVIKKRLRLQLEEAYVKK